MMQQFKARVSEHECIAGSFQYLHLELDNPERIEFQAGQYLILTIDAARGIRRNYSIASRPEMSHAVELLVDVKPQGLGSEYLKNLKPGDQVEFVAPFGSFVVDESTSHDARSAKRNNELSATSHELLFVATGSGISPIRSMILDLLISKKYQGPIRLWWGMRREEDCFWVEDFDGLEREYKNFTWDLVLSQPPENWPLHSGHVTSHVLSYVQKVEGKRQKEEGTKSLDINPSSFCFYLCGNRLMIEELSTKLAGFGINTEHIHTEKFF